MCITRFIGHAVVVLALLLARAAHADDLADFNAAVEAAMRHHRVALGYLRTGNIEFATQEVEETRAAWAKVGALPRPAAFRDPERYTGTMLDIATGLVGTDLVLKMGNADVARDSLEQMRVSLSKLRRESGITVLADCVLDANTAMAPLAAHDTLPDWSMLAAHADAYRAILQRCDGMAAPAIRTSGEFRRLIDGARASLDQFPRVVAPRDRDLLHRLLGELRAFDNLLAFRYG